jgi:hypothetical protein
MRHLKHFESFTNETNQSSNITTDESSNITTDESLELHKKSLEYLAKLSDSEKLKLKSDLEKFASDHGLKLEDLRNRKLVENLLNHETQHSVQTSNEGVMSWLKSNWAGLLRLISKYGTILSIVTFALGLGVFYATGIDTMPIIKTAAAAFIISNAAGVLSGLG